MLRIDQIGSAKASRNPLWPTHYLLKGGIQRHDASLPAAVRHAKRRFVHPAMLPGLARVLKPGGVWRVASDDPTYQAWVRAVMAAQDLFDAPPAVET